jgi:hypothetical protein
MLHLFFTCDFSQNLWWKIGEEWNTNLMLIDMILDEERRSFNPFFKIAMIVGCWSLWNHMNSITFDNQQRSLDICYKFFTSSIQEIRHRVKPGFEGGNARLDRYIVNSLVLFFVFLFLSLLPSYCT